MSQSLFYMGSTSSIFPEKKVLERVEMPARRSGPPRPRKFETPDTLTHGLALTPDGKELWVTSLLDDASIFMTWRPRSSAVPWPLGMGRTGLSFLLMENMAASATRIVMMFPFST